MIEENLLEAPDGFILVRVNPKPPVIVISQYEKIPDPLLDGLCVSSRYDGIVAGDHPAFFESAAIKLSETIMRVSGDSVEALMEVKI